MLRTVIVLLATAATNAVQAEGDTANTALDALAQTQAHACLFEDGIDVMLLRRGPEGTLGAVGPGSQDILVSEGDGVIALLRGGQVLQIDGDDSVLVADGIAEQVRCVDATTQLQEAMATAADGDLEDLLGAVENLELTQKRLAEVEGRLAATIVARHRAEETAVLLVQENEDLNAELSRTLLLQIAMERQVGTYQSILASSEPHLRAQLAAALSRAAAAEETATLLVEAQEELSAELMRAVRRQEALEQEAGGLRAELVTSEPALRAQLAEGRRDVRALNQQVATLRTQVASLQALLGEAEAADVAADVQIESLGEELNVALARAATAERARADLEAAERARAEEEAQLARAEAEDLETYRSEFFGRIRPLLEGEEGVQVVGDRFVFSSEVLFEPASATLSPEGQAEIANVADLLGRVVAEIPDGIDWVIRVDGHTDDQPLSGGGRIRDNWELSQARALSVVRQMSEVEGLPPERLAANGFGEYQPLDPADTLEARARNRRIEIKLTER